MHWDLSSYQVCEQGVIGGPHNESFTEALWKAILLTKDTRWVKNGKAAPQTHVWDEWLVEAETQAQLAKYHVGPVEDTIFSEQPAKGIIWDVPKDWDPKMAWNRINQEDMQAKTGGALPANKAA